MATQAGDIADLVNSVVEDHGKEFLVDIATDLRSYPACERLMAKKRQKPFTGSGYQVKFPLLYQSDDNTRAVGFYDVDNIDQVDGTVYGTVPFRHITTGSHFDVKELPINSAPNRIFDFVAAKEKQMWIKWFETMEGYFWAGPSSSSDTVTPYGLTKYWLDHDATTGFNGGNHTNFSSGPAGVSCSTYSKWSHYTGQFSAVSEEDAILLIRKALHYTRYMGIPNNMMKDYSAGKKYNLGIYTVADNIFDLETLQRSRDDNIGPDPLKYMNQVMINRVPVEEVPYLTANRDTSKPFIGLDWDVICTIYPDGLWERRTPYYRAPGQHDVRVQHVDCSRNFVVLNRRRLWTVAKAAYVSS